MFNKNNAIALAIRTLKLIILQQMIKKRASNEQLEWLVSQLEVTPALATGRHQGQNGRSHNRDRTRTGGGPSSAIELTSLEERVLVILGPEAVYGVDSGAQTLPLPMNPVS